MVFYGLAVSVRRDLPARMWKGTEAGLQDLPAFCCGHLVCIIPHSAKSFAMGWCLESSS